MQIEKIKDDPIKPWKALMGPLSGLLAYYVASGIFNAPWDIIISGFASGLAIYFTPNPKQLEVETYENPAEEGYLF